jgi:hypothetical protein
VRNGPPQRDDGTDGTNPRVRALIILADTDPTIGKAAESSGLMIENVLQTQLSPNERANRVVLRQRNHEFNKQKILSAIDSMPVRPNKDTLFCFWCGHGAVAPNQKHFFQLEDNRFLFRDELLRSLRNKHAKLTVLLTESCSGYIQVRSQTVMEVIAGKVPVTSSLLLKHSGVVDINSSSPGELTWTFNAVSSPGGDGGGLFSKSFYFACLDEQSPATWTDFFESVKADTERRFQEIKDLEKVKKSKMEHQTPFPFTSLMNVQFDRQ